MELTLLLLATLVSVDTIPPPDSVDCFLESDTIQEVELAVFPPDGVPPPLSYQVSWGDGTTEEWTRPVDIDIEVYLYHRYRQPGRYEVTARARDGLSRVSGWTAPLPVVITEPRLKWLFPTFDPVVGSPALDPDGNVYFGDEGGWVYSLDPAGQLRWTFQAGEAVMASVAVVPDARGSRGCNPLSWFRRPRPRGSLVYAACLDSFLYCLDGDGRLRWKLLLGDEVYSAPAVGADGTVYVGTDKGLLLAVAPDGRLRWEFDCGAEIASSPSIGTNGLIYLTSDSVYCLDAGRRVRWTFGTSEPDDYFFAGAAPAPDGTVYAATVAGTVYAIGPDGRLRWQAPVPDRDEIRTEPVFDAAGNLYVGTDGDYLCVMPPGGTFRVVYEALDIVTSTVAVSSAGTAYFLPDDGTLYACGADHRMLWRQDVATEDKDIYYSSSPTIGPDGTVYVGSWDGGLYAFTGDGPPAASFWPQYRGDARHTGRTAR